MSLILSGTDGVSDIDGSASTPAIRGTDTNTGIFFPAADTIAFAEGGAECARFDSSGQLGIGTTTPASGLEIKGTGSFPRLTLSDTSIAGSATIGCNDGDLVLTADSGGAVAGSLINFYVDTTERMRIDNNGSLLVGTTSVSNYSTGFAIGDTTSSATYVRIGHNLTGANYSYMNFGHGSADIGSISQNSAGTAVSYNTSSDYRLKENIAPMTGALNKVTALKPVTYTWKIDGSEGEGFIAHELAEVVPHCVTGEKDAVETVDIKDEDGNVIGQETKPVYQGIDTSFLVATLTAAIQEQQTIITDLKSRIEALEAK
jgi:hypothetical protein